MQYNESQPVTLDDVTYIIEQLMLPHNVKEDNIYNHDKQGKFI